MYCHMHAGFFCRGGCLFRKEARQGFEIRFYIPGESIVEAFFTRDGRFMQIDGHVASGFARFLLGGHRL